MQELSQNEIDLVSGGNYTDGTIFDLAGNIVQYAGKALQDSAKGLVATAASMFGLATDGLYNAGEAIDTGLVGIGKSILQIPGALLGTVAYMFKH
ncbi:hypothetical protein [Burkholderia sp. TSV86]|uniref:hypothetical protein n=1 Tax=Burkholderia sp. TSV86 TaxID=1385594 RepID=UPI000AD2E945|nr:hypothetical protein [Burkholderia sp. TSV86]